MRFRSHFWLAAAGLALGATTVLRSAIPERKVFQFGEFTIEAAAGDEAFVEALAVRLEDFKMPPVPVPPRPKLSLEDVGRKREAILGRLAGFLGLATPTEQMGKDFDLTFALRKGYRPILATGVPHHFALWRPAEIQVRSAAGQAVPAVRNDKTMPFTLDSTSGEGRYSLWSIVISPAGEKTPDDEAAAALADLTEFHAAMFRADLENFEVSRVHDFLRGLADDAITEHFLASPDRRWFCEGVSNYLALRLIEAEIGVEEGRNYYDLDGELRRYADRLGQISLSAWPLLDHQSEAWAQLSPRALALATKVIAEVCAKHGDALLPKLFQQIAKTPKDKANMDTVFKAFRRVTGEDLHSYLPKPTGKK